MTVPALDGGWRFDQHAGALTIAQPLLLDAVLPKAEAWSLPAAPLDRYDAERAERTHDHG